MKLSRSQKNYQQYYNGEILNFRVIFIVWIVFILPFTTEKNLELHKNVCENKDFYNVIMFYEDTKILEINQNQKSDKVPFAIFAYFESIIEKIDGCKNNLENSSTTKVSDYIPWGYSMSTISSVTGIENNHDVYRGKRSYEKALWILKKVYNENN